MKQRKPITPDNAYLRLATLCARCEHAEGDLRRKLHEWGVDPTHANAIIERLKQERFLDNGRYARAYCRDKLRFNGWGRLKLAFMLKGKGIEQDIIDAALSEIDNEHYALPLPLSKPLALHDTGGRTVSSALPLCPLLPLHSAQAEISARPRALVFRLP